MTKNRSFTYGACLAIIVSIAVWGAIGRGGADAAALYGWVEWLVLEGTAPAVALDLVVALSIVAAIKYSRYFATRDGRDSQWS